MTDTYSKHADVCAKFYELTLDSRAVADFVFAKSGARTGQKALFVGGMFGVASSLARTLELTIVDYTDEMVGIGRSLVPDARVLKADLKDLPFRSEFDLVFVIGRVFTHMIAQTDLRSAVQSCRKSLRPGGTLLADNYETDRIQTTNYFNGELGCGSGETQITRRSTTTLLTADPFVVRWDAEYTGQFGGSKFRFTDSMNHRAFSRTEFAEALRTEGFQVLEQGDNFDETSFYTRGVLPEQA